MRRTALLVILGVLALAACGPGSREAGPFQGRWRSEGFGTFMVIEGGDVDIYEHTQVSCVRVLQGSARGISDVVAREGDRLVLDDGGRVVRFDAVEVLPMRCADEFFTGDPDFTIRVVDATFREHYFPGVDPAWARRVDEALAAVGPDSTAEDVAGAVIAVLQPLGNPEVRLAVGDAGEEVWRPGLPDFVEVLTERISERGRNDEAIVFGEVGGVAYLAPLHLEAADEEDAADITGAVDRALGAVDGPLIVDLRVVSGGLEQLALSLASRFLSENRIVASRRVVASAAPGMVDAGDITVAPRRLGTFSGELVVLIGPGTTGNGEVLAAALGVVPAATLVGQPTGGAPGRPLVRVLPTEWTLGVPHQALYLPDGTRIGPGGLMPDVMVPLTVEDLQAGEDPQLERAVEVAKGG